MIKQAFERGFIKAAMSIGMNPLDAISILKYAEGPTPIPPLPSPSIGTQFGNFMQNTGSNGLTGINKGVEALKGLDAGKTTSNAIQGVKQNINDAMPGVQSYMNSKNDLIKSIADAGHFAATNTIPNVMNAARTQGPQAIDELLSKYGPKVLELIDKNMTVNKGMNNTAQEVAGSATKGTQGVLDSFKNYFSQGPGTNITHNLKDKIEELINTHPEMTEMFRERPGIPPTSQPARPLGWPPELLPAP